MRAPTDISWADLTDYLAGEGDADLHRRVEAWAAHPDRHRTLEELRQIWEASGRQDRQALMDRQALDARWGDLLERMERRGVPVPEAPRPARRRLRPVRLPAPAPAVPRRSSGLRQFARVGAIVGVLAALAVLAVLAWQPGDDSEPAVAPMQVVTTEPGQRARLRLADGTRVHLNVDSELRFTPGFTDGLRRVHLRGEAYFDVARDEARPFVIHAADADIRVLGTSFGVRAYREGAVQVAVAEGAVALQPQAAAPADTVVLRAGDLGRIVGADALALRQDAGFARRLAWTEGRLVFEDAPLAEVAAELERWYKLRIEVDVPAADRLNAEFRDEPLSEILNSISATLGLRYEREHRRVRFLPAAD